MGYGIDGIIPKGQGKVVHRPHATGPQHISCKAVIIPFISEKQGLKQVKDQPWVSLPVAHRVQ